MQLKIVVFILLQRQDEQIVVQSEGQSCKRAQNIVKNEL